MSLSDGCEFIDDGNYGVINVVRDLWSLDPRGHLVQLIPIGVVLLIADPLELHKASKDYDRVSELYNSIKKDGIKSPMTIFWDDDGNVRYKDGYHRLGVMQSLGYSQVPVVLEHTPGIIRGVSVRISNFVKLMSYVT